MNNLMAASSIRVCLALLLCVGVVIAAGFSHAADVPLLKRQTNLCPFLDCRIVPKVGNAWDYTFKPGKLPNVEWDRPEVVEQVMGNSQLTVRWFDNQLREVTTAAQPGRYAFYAEGKAADGRIIRRAATVYCRPKQWDGWSEKLRAQLDFLPVDGLDPVAWKEHQEPIADFAGRLVLLSILRQREGAILMSYLHEIEATGKKASILDSPTIHDHEFHLRLKRKLLGLDGASAGLKPPRRSLVKPAPILHPGTEAEAGFKAGTVNRLRTICSDWFEQSQEPFNVVIARRGVVILDDTFGNWTWGELTRETPTEMASLTKLLTGLLFAQFVDQGLIDIDAPVGRYLPDFPVQGPNTLTLRHCFTHTSGLFGHEEWGGLHNPWLDNVIANATPHLRPGEVLEYNGMGYDLAGKVMESVSGKSIFRLMREQLFDPLEMRRTTLEEDLGFSCFSTASEFARIGQLMLNRGGYGETKFFNSTSFEKLLPRHLREYYPTINREWGIGITWMRQKHPDAGQNGVPDDATVLSRNVIGHGSATAAILRVDLDNELVISQSRRRAGKDYGRHLLKFLTAIEEGVE
jgi:hypothetical protein